MQIEEFYKEIASSQNSLYEGHWRVNEAAVNTDGGLLERVYGRTFDGDDV